MKFIITFTDGERSAGQRVPGWEQLTSAELSHLRVERDEFESILQHEKGTRITHLESPSQAKTVFLNTGGRVEVTEGPLTRGPDTIGGFFIIEAESMDEAVEWAKMDRWLVGASEVRQIKE